MNSLGNIRKLQIGHFMKAQQEPYKGLYWGIMAFFLFSYVRLQDIILPLQKLHPVLILVPVLMVSYAMSSKAGTPLKLSSFIKTLVFFSGVMFLSVPFSFHDGKSFDGAILFLMTVVTICFFITIAFNSFLRIEKLFLLVNMAIVVFAIDIGIKYLSGESHEFIRGMVGAQMGNPNDLCVNFVLFLPMVFYYFLTAKTSLVRWLSLGMFGIVLFGVLGTQSRGGMLGTAVVLVLLIMKTEKKGLALVSGTIALIAVMSLAPSGSLERFSTIWTYKEDSNAVTRTWFYKSSIKMLLNRPLTGVGMDAWTNAYSQGGFRYKEDPSNRWPDAHSSYFQIMGELGFPGILAYLYMIYLTLASIKKLETKFKMMSKYKRQLYFIQCLRIGLIGFWISTTFQSFSYFPTAYNMMAVVFAMEGIYKNHPMVNDSESGNK